MHIANIVLAMREGEDITSHNKCLCVPARVAPPGLRPNAFILKIIMILPAVNPNAIQNKSTSQSRDVIRNCPIRGAFTWPAHFRK